MYIIFTTRPILGQRIDSRKGALEEAGGAEQHNIRRGAKTSWNLVRVHKVMRAGHRRGGGVGGCSSGVV